MRFRSEPEPTEEVSLQITSMADIFMILLVFLLKSYATGLASVSASQGVVLPEAHGRGVYQDALKVEILRDSVLVDQKAAARLRDFAFLGAEDGISRALQAERGRTKGDAADSQLLLLADRRTPYATLKRVMGAAAGAGFADLHLAVVQGD
jgi:biopolymer transport protein ExbD